MSTSPPTAARDHVGSRTLTRSAVTTLFTVALAATSLGRAQADPAGAQSELTAVSGQGAGLVTIAPTSAAQGTFDARVTVNVHNSAPNTTFAVTRGGGDGTIDGVFEWSRLRPDFLSRAAHFGLGDELLDAMGIRGS